MNAIFATLFIIILFLAVKKKDAQKESIKWLQKVCSNLDCKVECIGICGSDSCLERVYYASIKREATQNEN